MYFFQLSVAKRSFHVLFFQLSVTVDLLLGNIPERQTFVAPEVSEGSREKFMFENCLGGLS